MPYVLRRVAGVAVVLAGIVLALWMTFGAPQSWTEPTRLWRIPLGLSALGMISGGTWLMVPDRDDEPARPPGDTA
ncbi:hypothetical protein [Streptomyces sp. TRM49041]|uniref:hypothetical protein n=1 Tax=Streptomyces sp. TRM49041 TaxID=2603216 RepID=UPI0011F053BE|nr:hypothetical protein [Streptomyces sp. TRM49041]